MALNFPNNPAGQTPVNTFSPDSTPDATDNGATYIWTGTAWTGTAPSGGGVTAGVDKIIAGANVSISPSSGTGNVTINSDDVFIPSVFTFKGTTLVSGDAPLNPAGGDLYINTADAVAGTTWTGIVGQTVLTNQLVFYSAAKSQWFAGAVQDNSAYMLKSGGEFTGTVTYLGRVTNNTDIQTKSSVITLIDEETVIPSVFHFQGTTLVSDTAPANPAAGDLYINTAEAVAAASWTGIVGQTVLTNQLVFWSGAKSQWFAGAVQDNSAYLLKSGGNITGTTTYEGRVTNDIDLQTKVSVQALIKDEAVIPSTFTFKGTTLVSGTVPVSPEGGDLYLNTATAVAAAGWTGIVGQTVLADQLVFYSSAKGQWFAGAVQDNSAYMLKSGGTFTGDVTYLGRVANNTDIQTKNSVQDLIKNETIIPSTFQFQGTTLVSGVAPEAPAGGDLYINTAEAVASASWTGIVGQTVLTNQLVFYSSAKAQWFAGAVQDNSAYL
ncbi:MAG: hypothetical protein ACR2M9_03160, partial [Cyanophyceae cyanobacterium]